MVEVGRRRMGGIVISGRDIPLSFSSCSIASVASIEGVEMFFFGGILVIEACVRLKTGQGLKLAIKQMPRSVCMCQEGADLGTQITGKELRLSEIEKDKNISPLILPKETTTKTSQLSLRHHHLTILQKDSIRPDILNRPETTVLLLV